MFILFYIILHRVPVRNDIEKYVGAAESTRLQGRIEEVRCTHVHRVRARDYSFGENRPL